MSLEKSSSSAGSSRGGAAEAGESVVWRDSFELGRRAVAWALIFSISVVDFAGLRVAEAAPPITARDTLTFYGELTNQASDAPLTGNVDIAVRMYPVGTGGAMLWSECWPSVAVSAGRISLNLGSTQPFAPSLGQFLAANPNLFVGLQVCDAGGACGTGCDGEMQPRIALGSIPYAGVASQAIDVFGEAINPALVTLAPTGATAVAVSGVGPIINSLGQWVGPPISGATGASGASGNTGAQRRFRQHGCDRRDGRDGWPGFDGRVWCFGRKRWHGCFWRDGHDGRDGCKRRVG